MNFYRPPTTQGVIDALASFNRAARAWNFYPEGHPTRRNSLMLAHNALRQILDGNTLSLACGRTGFSFPDGERLKDAHAEISDTGSLREYLIDTAALRAHLAPQPRLGGR